MTLTAQKQEDKPQEQPKAKPTAAQRTLSMFTGRTDLDDANARDGSLAQPMPPKPRMRKTRWESIGTALALTGYRLVTGSGKTERVLGVAERQSDGRWCAWRGQYAAVIARDLPTHHHAANAVERGE